MSVLSLTTYIVLPFLLSLSTTHEIIQQKFRCTPNNWVIQALLLFLQFTSFWGIYAFLGRKDLLSCWLYFVSIFYILLKTFQNRSSEWYIRVIPDLLPTFEMLTYIHFYFLAKERKKYICKQVQFPNDLEFYFTLCLLQMLWPFFS